MRIVSDSTDLISGYKAGEAATSQFADNVSSDLRRVEQIQQQHMSSLCLLKDKMNDVFLLKDKGLLDPGLADSEVKRLYAQYDAQERIASGKEAAALRGKQLDEMALTDMDRLLRKKEEIAGAYAEGDIGFDTYTKLTDKIQETIKAEQDWADGTADDNKRVQLIIAQTRTELEKLQERQAEYDRLRPKIGEETYQRISAPVQVSIEQEQAKIAPPDNEAYLTAFRQMQDGTDEWLATTQRDFNLAASVINSTRTPLERYKAMMVELNRLRNSELIDSDTFIKAAKGAKEAERAVGGLHGGFMMLRHSFYALHMLGPEIGQLAHPIMMVSYMWYGFGDALKMAASGPWLPLIAAGVVAVGAPIKAAIGAYTEWKKVIEAAGEASAKAGLKAAQGSSYAAAAAEESARLMEEAYSKGAKEAATSITSKGKLALPEEVARAEKVNKAMEDLRKTPAGRWAAEKVAHADFERDIAKEIDQLNKKTHMTGMTGSAAKLAEIEYNLWMAKGTNITQAEIDELVKLERQIRYAAGAAADWMIFEKSLEQQYIGLSEVEKEIAKQEREWRKLGMTVEQVTEKAGKYRKVLTDIAIDKAILKANEQISEAQSKITDIGKSSNQAIADKLYRDLMNQGVGWKKAMDASNELKRALDAADYKTAFQDMETASRKSMKTGAVETKAFEMAVKELGFNAGWEAINARAKQLEASVRRAMSGTLLEPFKNALQDAQKQLLEFGMTEGEKSRFGLVWEYAGRDLRKYEEYLKLLGPILDEIKDAQDQVARDKVHQDVMNNAEKYQKKLEDLNKIYPESMRGSEDYRRAVSKLNKELEGTKVALGDAQKFGSVGHLKAFEEFQRNIAVQLSPTKSFFGPTAKPTSTAESYRAKIAEAQAKANDLLEQIAKNTGKPSTTPSGSGGYAPANFGSR